MKKLILVFLLSASAAALGQDAPKVPQPPKSFMTMLKETVVVIKLECQVGEKAIPGSATGFFVAVPDDRVGKGRGFIYLVTNRHVAECWDHSQHPMEVKSISLRYNLSDGTSTTAPLNDKGNAPWVLPPSESVDLAVLPLMVNPKLQDKLDWMTIRTLDFATDEMFSSGRIHEGQSIIFTGFFPKIEGVKKAHPIVREGIISSLDDEPFILLKKDVPAKFYLGDVHVVAGNSGSPVMADLAGRQGGMMFAGEDYRLIGVVSGYLSEDEDMTLHLETTVETTASANSGITTIVPVSELKKLLDDDRLRAQRNAAAATISPTK